MPDDRPDQQSALDARTFQSWVESLSESRGASREEVLEQLISSYWTLHELLQVIEESGDDAVLHPDDEGRSDAPGAARSAAAAGLTEADADGDSDAADRVDRLDERVESLAERSEERWTTLADRHDDLESRVDGEFENLRGVLEYLIDTTDDLAERTDALVSDHVEARRRRRTERAALLDLKREAGRLGVSTAACDHCGESVALGTLATPRCPQCAATFDGVVPRTGWLDFGPSRLTVADPADGGARDVADDWPTDLSDERPTGDDHSRPMQGDRSRSPGADAGPAGDRRAEDPFQWLDEDQLL